MKQTQANKQLMQQLINEKAARLMIVYAIGRRKDETDEYDEKDAITLR